MNINDSLYSLKEKIYDQFQIPIDQQQLEYAGKSLDDINLTILQCNLCDYSTIYLSINNYNIGVQNDKQKPKQNDTNLTSEQKDKRIQELKHLLQKAQKKIIELEKKNSQLREQIENANQNQYVQDIRDRFNNEDPVSSPDNSMTSLKTSPEAGIIRPYVFGKYDFQDIKVLGKGGFGTVYLGTWMGSQYAIKVFKIKGADQGSFNFLYEVSMFSKMISDEDICENIVRYCGLSIDIIDDTTFEAKIILEYCPKGELQQLLPVKQKWCLQIAKGINYLHSKNIIHCDLKPQNIMMTEQDDCRIIDFGISKGIETTKITSKMGITPRWSPYEFVVDQSLGMNIMSKKSDAWMFGCIMFYIFYEVEPWRPNNSDQTRELMKQRKDIFENTKIDEDKKILVPPSVKQLLLQILNHDYQQRPDMDKIIEELNKLKSNY